MAAPSSLEAVKRKIQCLQQQADEAEDRAQVLQRELDLERDLREKVRPPAARSPLSVALSGLPRSCLPVSGSLSGCARCAPHLAALRSPPRAPRRARAAGGAAARWEKALHDNGRGGPAPAPRRWLRHSWEMSELLENNFSLPVFPEKWELSSSVPLSRGRTAGFT